MVVSMAYPDFMSIKMQAKIKVHIAVRDNVCNVTLKLRFKQQRDPNNLNLKAGIIIFSCLAPPFHHNSCFQNVTDSVRYVQIWRFPSAIGSIILS